MNDKRSEAEYLGYYIIKLLRVTTFDPELYQVVIKEGFSFEGLLL